MAKHLNLKFELGDGKKLDSYSVHSACELLRTKDLILDPAYQTGVRWKNSQKATLIDSLIQGLDLPKFYFRTVQAGGEERHEVVDGQQRLRSISDFVNNKFRLASGDHKGKTFAQLPSQLRRRITDFELHAVVLTGDRWSDEVIRDLFLRLQMGTPLNPAEKRRALPGEFPKIVAKLASHKLLRVNSNIGESRYAREDAVAKILHLMLSTGRPKIAEAAIRKTYLNHQDLSLTNSKVKKVKDALEYLARSLKDSGSHFRKFNLLSVVTALTDVMSEYALSSKHKAVGDLLLDIEYRRTQNDALPANDPQKNLFLSKLSETARSDRTDHLEWRRDFYASQLIQLRLPMLDKRRAFSSTERGILFRSQNGHCKTCKKKITVSDSHVDHIKPYSKGGLTILANAQLLCITCNTKKGNRD